MNTRTAAPHRALRVCLVLALALAGCLPLAAEAAAAPVTVRFLEVKAILQARCAACHGWTGSRGEVVAGGKVVPGDPGASGLWQMIESDSMPASGDPLSAVQKATIRDWIAAGAPGDEPAAAAPQETAAPAAAPAAAVPSPRSLPLFPDKVAFHKVTGFTSTALLLGAGALGVVHFVNMMEQGHYYRDLISFPEEGPDSVRAPYIVDAWGDDAALRWWHVGLLAAGETLYLGDAISGISMMTKKKPGRITRRDLHRWAFYTHAALMGAQVVLGFLTTDALSRGDHDMVIGLGAAHAGVGVAIPLVMLGAGLGNLLLPPVIAGQ
jgi:hypothetical protein